MSELTREQIEQWRVALRDGYTLLATKTHGTPHGEGFKRAIPQLDALCDMALAALSGVPDGQWIHCCPELLNLGLSCKNTPRRDCTCPEKGSHDHWIAHSVSLSGVRVPVDELRIVTEFFGERNWPDTKVGNAAYALHGRLLAASKGERDD